MVRRLHAKRRSWHGDDDAPVRECRGTTPLAHSCAPLESGL